MGAIAMLRVRPATRFRLRTLMLCVLFTGVTLGAERAWHRRQECLDRAAYHAAAEAKLSAEASTLAAELAEIPPALLNGSCGNTRRYAEAVKRVMINCATRAGQHGRLKERCLHMASRHWETSPETQ